MWSRVDDNLPHHPKFVKAGPVASLLWVCGNCYCNRYLTDGFIAEEALATLGCVPRVHSYAKKLTRIGLWNVVAGGYQVHHFHDHNPLAADVKAKREWDRLRKQAAESARNPSGIHAESTKNPEVPARAIPSHPSTDQDQDQDQDQERVRRTLTPGVLTAALETEFQKFSTAYPAGRRVGGKLARHAFRTARQQVDLATMLAALNQQKRSEQWQTPKLIPLMTTWLNQERWGQVLPPAVAGPGAPAAGHRDWLAEFGRGVQSEAARWGLKDGCRVGQPPTGGLRLIVAPKYHAALEAERGRLETIAPSLIIEPRRVT